MDFFGSSIQTSHLVYTNYTFIFPTAPHNFFVFLLKKFPIKKKKTNNKIENPPRTFD